MVHLGNADDGAVPDADALRLHRAGGQEHLGRRAVRVLLEEVMLDGPHGVEAELVGQTHLLEGVLVDGTLDAVGKGTRDRQLEEETELHAGAATLASPGRQRQGRAAEGRLDGHRRAGRKPPAVISEEESVMSQMALPKVAAPTALHRAESDLPFVTFFEGLDFQLLQASVENGLWVVRTRFQPGVTIPTHRHTGEVFAVTFRGSWRYLEYPDLNTAGSYLFEPAGSQHTLHVPASNTEITDVWFAIRGANLNLDEHGNVASVWDATFMIETYLELCARAGYGRPAVIGL